MTNPYAIGKQVYLRSPSENDLEGKWHEWFSDPEITEYLADRYWPNSIEMQQSFYESIKNSKDRLVLSICDMETDEHIGICNLSAINWVHRYADIAFIIGEKKYRNGSVGLETTALLLDIAFNKLNLLNLRATYFASHPHTPVILKIFGFKEVGRFENFLSHKGNYVDLVYSQLSRESWAARNEAKKG